MEQKRGLETVRSASEAEAVSIRPPLTEINQGRRNTNVVRDVNESKQKITLKANS